MAKLKIIISPDARNPRSYIPKELVDEGFIGEVMILADAFTATMLKPGIPLDKIKESLEIVLKDIELRMAEQPDEESSG